MSDEGEQFDAPAGSEDAPTVLVEIEPGTALLFGEPVPGMDVVPIALLNPSELRSMSDRLLASTSVLNVGAQAANSLTQVRGLVRLAPETLKALETARPLTQGGHNLGVLVGKNGKMVAQVRWLPATGAQAAGAAAAIGPALALLAIQMQLNQISGLVRQNIELTSTVLKTVRHAQWAQLHGLDGAVGQALDEALDVGEVTDKIWNNIQGREHDLRSSRKYFRDQVEDHTRALAAKRGHTDRRNFLVEHGDAILADAHGLLVAQSAWFTYQALRAGNTHLTAATNPRDAKLVEKIARDAPVEHRLALDEGAALLDDLLREANILSELEGRWTFPFGKEKRSAGDVARMAGALRESLATLREGLSPGLPMAPPVPEVMAFPPDKAISPKLQTILRWHLAADEPLLALADSYPNNWLVNNNGFVAVTDRRVLVMNQGDLLKKGLIEHEFPLSDVRYVRYTRATTSNPPNIAVFTPLWNHQLNFSGWAKAPNDQTAIDGLAQLLVDAADVPSDERNVTRSRRELAERSSTVTSPELESTADVAADEPA